MLFLCNSFHFKAVRLMYTQHHGREFNVQGRTGVKTYLQMASGSMLKYQRFISLTVTDLVSNTYSSIEHLFLNFSWIVFFPFVNMQYLKMFAD